ncbi:MAG: Ig-like domain-containing protein, partial [Acidobacteriaceae bacterium]
MSFAERTAMPLGFSRVKFGSFVRALTNQPLRVLRAEFGGLVVVLAMGLAFLALSCATERAGAQTTFTCSTATPSTNCALSIPGGDQTPNAPPAYAAANSSTLTVSGATGPVASIKVVLLGVTSSTGPWAGYSSTNENTYNSISWSSFLLEDPAGNQLDLLGGTGTGLDPLSGTNITIEDGATVAPPTTSTTVQTSWPATGSVTVEPSQYYAFFNGVPIYDSTPADWSQPDGSATLASKFNGAAANGPWTLHLASSDILINYPDWVSDPVSITGWQLILTYSTLPATTTTISSSLNPSYTTSPNNTTTLTATVDSGGQPIGGGTVTFTANSSPISCSGGNQTVSGGTATCTAALSAEGNYSIGASYSGSSSYAPSSGGNLNQLVTNHTTNPSGTTYCNTGNLATAGNTATETIYPSYIQIPSTVTQSAGNVSVTLNGLQSSNGVSGGVSSTSFLLVAPGHTNNLDFLSHGVTAVPQPSVDVTFADNNPLVPNGEGENGGVCNGGSGPNCALQNNTTYGPTDDSQTADSFITQSGSPAPPSPNYPLPFGSTNAMTFEQAFNGAPAAGNWLLYVENDSGLPLSLSGGWCIDLTLNTGAPTTTTVTSTKDPDFTGSSVSFTATVQSGGNPVNTGSVTFLDNGEPPTGGNNVIAVNGAGQAVFTTSQLTEGDHKISASYGGTSSYNPSENFVWQREDDTTAVSGVSGDAGQFCNTGAVLTAEGQTGAFTPNPSNIFVNNLPGTVKTVSLTLDNFYTFSDQIYEIESMVAGPTGAALDFFSNTGASNTVLSSGNYVFTDSAASEVPQSAYGPGSYKPT